LTLSGTRTPTWPANGKVAHLFSQGVYFAHAGRPWQRGTNENTNGLLRQYFPEGESLRRYTTEDLRRIEQRLNN
jgi:IS30 family transposase